MTHLGPALKASAIQIIWWLAAFLFLPWTAFLLPLLGVWYILFLAIFTVYRSLDEAFHIEEQIEAHFPGQIDRGED